MDAPLHKIRVIDFTNFMAGPLCSLILAELGAEAIKIEPLEGENGRRSGFITELGESISFQARNRGKLSVTVDVKTKLGLDLVHDLVRISDVFVENYRVGVMEKLGLGYDSLKALQPKIVMTSITGYGQYGCYSHKPAQDMLMHALSGIMSLNGSPDGPPTRVGVPIADRVGGIVGALATIAALYRRTDTGVGEHVDVALLDGMIYALDDHPTQFYYNGKLYPRTGNRYPGTAPCGYYECKDGAVYIIASGDQRWQSLCKMVGKPELAGDPRLLQNTGRSEHQDEIDSVINTWVEKQTMDEVLKKCEQFDIPASPVLTIPEVIENQQVKDRKMFEYLDHPLLGKTLYPSPLLKMQPPPVHMNQPAPLLGEHSGYVCRELLGYSEEKIQLLVDEGVICTKKI